MRHVVLDPVQKQWPVLLQYRARLLKMYLDDVTQDRDAEVHEDLLSLYMAVAHEHSVRQMQPLLPDEDRSEQTVSFRTFELPDGSLVPVGLKVDFSDVGEAMWPASVRLAEVLLQDDCALVRGKRVLELGCGVGFTGLVLARSECCHQLTLSDISQGGLELLRDNLSHAKTEACVKRLDWTAATDEELRNVDVLYAADCWYDYEMSPVWSTLVSRICILNPGCVFINATALRNERTYDLFKSHMLEVGFVSETVAVAESAFCFPIDPSLKYPIIVDSFHLS